MTQVSELSFVLVEVDVERLGLLGGFGVLSDPVDKGLENDAGIWKTGCQLTTSGKGSWRLAY
jgi:hypothetical protein